MSSLMHVEYLEAAMEKTSNSAEIEELGALKLLVIALNAQEEFTLRQCVENRIAAGESPKRIAAPRSLQSTSDAAAEDIHKLELRKCRRAQSALEIVESLLTLSRDKTTFNRSLLSYIDLPENRALSESLLIQEEELQAKFEQFLLRWG